MKNITVTVDDELYRLSRIRAAEAGTTVTGIVRACLVELSQAEGVEGETQIDHYNRLLQVTDGLIARMRASGRVFRVADNLPREELYNRDALR